MKAIIHLNGDSSVGLFDSTYEMPDLPDEIYEDSDEREHFRKKIGDLYSEIDGQSRVAHVFFEPFESMV